MSSKFYHVELDIDKPLNELIRGHILFYDEKDGDWNYIWKHISKDGNWKGYNEYEITIPNNRFTTSFEPRTPKILRITKETYKDYIKLYDSFMKKNKNYTRMDWHQELLRRNIIGLHKFSTKSWRYPIFSPNNHPLHNNEEGWLMDKPDDITIRLIEKYRK